MMQYIVSVEGQYDAVKLFFLQAQYGEVKLFWSRSV